MILTQRRGGARFKKTKDKSKKAKVKRHPRQTRMFCNDDFA